MTEIKLKPCPFCGSGVTLEQYKADGLRITCPQCHIKYEQRWLTKDRDWLAGRMADTWNTRAIELDRQQRGEPVDAHSEWTDYAKRSGLLSADGVASEPARAQTAWNAFSFAWNRSYRVNAATQPDSAMAGDSTLLDMLETLCNGLEWNIENHPEIMNESDAEALAQARALLKRVQPASGNKE